jgi:hypothetical protein
MVPTRKTDNDLIWDKLRLRLDHLPSDPVKVLDCFTGKGVLWKAIRKKTGRNITVLPIDIRGDDIGFHLHGDNQDFLSTLDLSRYNVIDLDAYGVPYGQLKIIFMRGYTGTIFVTFIQSVYGAMPHGLLHDVGFTQAMIEKTPSLFNKRGWEYFLQWLGLNGITEVWHRSNTRKHYLAFNCAVPGALHSGIQLEDMVVDLS